MRACVHLFYALFENACASAKPMGESKRAATGAQPQIRQHANSAALQVVEAKQGEVPESTAHLQRGAHGGGGGVHRARHHAVGVARDDHHGGKEVHVACVRLFDV